MRVRAREVYEEFYVITGPDSVLKPRRGDALVHTFSLFTQIQSQQVGCEVADVCWQAPRGEAVVVGLLLGCDQHRRFLESPSEGRNSFRSINLISGLLQIEWVIFVILRSDSGM
jgi:hypothetical protein